MRCVLPVILTLWAVARAAPTLVYPLADQQPPVARVGSEFVFDILAGTFTSNTSSDPLTYTVSSLPSWLSFSPSIATFNGTPAATDVGQYPITLTAADGTGSVSSNFTLVVSNNSAPTVHMGFRTQIGNETTRDFASAEAMPDGTGVMVPPYWSFALGWNGNTFRAAPNATSQRLYYMARVRGQTGLPDWLHWSNTTFTFNGVAPANGTYTIVVTGTDIWGYTAAQTSFVLAVGTGDPVEFTGEPQNFTTVARSDVNYKLDTSGVVQGGKALAASDLVVTPDLSNYKWLQFNQSSKTFTGKTPDAYVNGTIEPLSIPVNIASTGNANNTLSTATYLSINVLPYFFTNFTLPNATAEAGKAFEYNIVPYLLNKTATTGATVVPPDAAQWLLYFPENHTLIGTPPVNLTYSSFTVKFLGTIQNATASTELNMTINNVTGPVGTGEPTPVPNGTIHHGLSRTKKIIIGVVVGVGGFLLILAALLLFFCCRRRKDDDDKASRHDPERMRTRSPSGTPATFVHKPGTPGGQSIDSDGTLLNTPGDAKVVKGDKEKPRRVGAIMGLFGAVDRESKEQIVEPEEIPVGHEDDSFCAPGEMIGVRDAAGRRAAPRPSLDHVRSTSMGSIASWESEPSMHWSGENDYLPPLDGSSTGSGMAVVDSSPASRQTARTNHTTRTAGTVGASLMGVVAGASAAGGSSGPDSDEPRPRPGFYPRFPRVVRAGDPKPFMSQDDVSTYSEFSEFQDMGSSRSLDSFADPGSAIGSASVRSSRYSNRSRSSWWASGPRVHADDSGGSGSAFGSGSLGTSGSTGTMGTGTIGTLGTIGRIPGPSGLSNTSATTGTFSDVDAVVATAHRQSFDTQRSSVVPPLPPTGARDLLSPVPSLGEPSDRTYHTPNITVFSPPPASRARQGSTRRQSSSKHALARPHNTRERIVSGTTASPVTPTYPEHTVFERDQVPVPPLPGSSRVTGEQLEDVDDDDVYESDKIVFSAPLRHGHPFASGQAL